MQANVQGRSLTEVTQDINATLESLRLPPGYAITQGGEARDQQEVFTRIFTALGAAVLLMYLILVVQFGSFLDPAGHPDLAAAVADRRGAGAAGSPVTRSTS